MNVTVTDQISIMSCETLLENVTWNLARKCHWSNLYNVMWNLDRKCHWSHLYKCHV